MAKGIREKIKLVSSAGTGHFYTTTKNKRTKPEKLELKKKTQQQTQADTVEESLIHQGRHAAWREFLSSAGFGFDAPQHRYQKPGIFAAGMY